MNKMKLVRLALSLCWLGLVPGGLACSGGEPAPAASPEAAVAPSTEADPAPAEPEPVLPNCDDGNCLSCGQGACPLGASCVTQGQQAPSCAWFPECAEKPGCACVLKVLGSGCSCTEGKAGPTLRCSP